MNFITVSGVNFYDGSKIWYPSGTSCWQPLGGAPSSSYATYLDGAISIFPYMNCTRFVNFFPSIAGTNAFSETYWVRVDYAIYQASLRGLRCILDLSDYKNLQIANGINPFTYDYTSFINFVTNRTNTYSGIIYKNDPTIWSYSIAGESHTFDFPGATNPQITSFFQTVSQLIKGQDSNHLVSSGGFNNVPTSYGPDWQSIWNISTIDFGNLHAYNGAADGPQYRKSDLKTMGMYAYSINKPWIIEEFGCPHSYGLDYYTTMYKNTIQWGTEYHLSGLYFWCFGFETISTGSYDVNSTYCPETVRVINSCYTTNGTFARINV